MAAKQGADQRKNYYSVAYGKLSSKVKDKPKDYSEIKETELKSKISNVENIDLRNKYVLKQGDFPFQVFYDSLSGDIRSIEKQEFDKGISLNVSILDTDGDLSVMSIKFYSKYTENFLNRLLSLSDLYDIDLSPYSIPSEYVFNGYTLNFFNQGIVIKKGNEKIGGLYDGKEGRNLPPTEKVMDSNGKEVTSRVKRIDFLYDKVRDKFFKLGNTAPDNPNPKVAEAPKKDMSVKTGLLAENPFEESEDELPF